MQELISEQDNKKMIIINYLIQKNTKVSMSEISKKTTISPKTVRSIIDSLKENPELSGNNLLIKRSESGHIDYVKINNHSLTDISYFYLKKSPLFSMLKEIFLRGKINNIDFCNHYYISQSSFSRCRTKLKTILGNYNLDLTMNCEIIGDEYQIRDFFYQLFIHSSSKWIFSSESFFHLEHIINNCFYSLKKISPVSRDSLRLILYICRIRTIQKKSFSSELDFSIKYENLVISKEVSTYLEIANIRNTKEEMNFLLLMLSKTCIVPSQNKFIITLPDHSPLKKISKCIMYRSFSSIFKGSEIDSSLFLSKINLLLISNYIGLHDSRAFIYSYDVDSYYYKNKQETQLFEAVCELVSEVNKEFNLSKTIFIQTKQTNAFDSFVNQMYLLTFSFLGQLESHSKNIVIHIFLQHTNQYIEDIMKKKITLLFSNRVRFINQYDTCADIYISDKKYNVISPRTEIIIVPTFSDIYSFNRLYTIVESKLLKKISMKSLLGTY